MKVNFKKIILLLLVLCFFYVPTQTQATNSNIENTEQIKDVHKFKY